MLTEDDKLRIRAEEAFRLEVSRQLAASEPRRSRRQRVWSLLNSSFMLWLLSSVVLASVTTAFTYYQSKRGDQVRKAEIERRLDTEISSRISSAIAGLRLDKEIIESGNSKESIEKGEKYTPVSIYSFTQSYLDNYFINDPSNPRDFSIYPEYKNRTFRSLIFELRAVVDPSMRPELTNVLTRYDKLLDLGSTESAIEKDKAVQESLKAVENAADLLNHLTKRRWRSQM